VNRATGDLVHFLKMTLKRLTSRWGRKKGRSAKVEAGIVDAFHSLYYSARRRTWGNTFWLGIPVQKCPFDLWVYQEIIFEVRPDVIIECGTASGGSALFLACVSDLVGKGRVVSIDIDEREARPNHPRIEYLVGSSRSEKIVTRVRELVRMDEKAIVILDSDHGKEHVLDELRIYSRFVSRDSYLIVEDTNLNGHPVNPDFGPGPMEAVQDFLKNNDQFIIDKSREKFYLTFSPGGFLRRVG